MNATTYSGIDILRAVCAFLVVVLHSSLIDVSECSGLDYLVQFYLSKVVATIAVPTFFFISGYLFSISLSPWNWDVWKHKVFRRVRSLAIPYLIWNVIAFVVFATLFHFIKSQSWTYLLENNGVYGLLWSNDGYPIDYPLWFVRDLMVLVIFSPALLLIIEKLKPLWGGLLGVLLFVPYLLNISIPIDGLSFTGILYFYWGAYLQLKWAWRGFPKVLTIIALIVGLALSFMCLFFDSQYYSLLIRLLNVTMVAVSFSIAMKSDRNSKRHIPILSESLFFIFASHAIIIFCVREAFELLLPKAPILLFYSTVIVLTLVICIGLFSLLKWLCPKLLLVLNGNR